METYIFQHVEFEGPGILVPLLKARGHNIHIVKLYAGDPIPHEDDIGFAILLGGPMSVLDEASYPYFVREKELCKDMVQLGKPILGICLGGQMIASAFRAAILKSPEKEVGWFPIQWNACRGKHGTGITTINALHWHGEMFMIPKEATKLASSEGCENQAFKLGSAIAMQFHLEASPESVESMLKNCRDDYANTTGKFIQSEKEIRDFSAQYMKDANDFMEKIIDTMLKKH